MPQRTTNLFVGALDINEVAGETVKMKMVHSRGNTPMARESISSRGGSGVNTPTGDYSMGPVERPHIIAGNMHRM